MSGEVEGGGIEAGSRNAEVKDSIWVQVSGFGCQKEEDRGQKTEDQMKEGEKVGR
jgi:hypothetical protein